MNVGCWKKSFNEKLYNHIKDKLLIEPMYDNYIMQKLPHGKLYIFIKILYNIFEIQIVSLFFLLEYITHL